MPAPHGRDLETTRARLRAWLAERLPGATRLEVGPLSGPAATGFSNETLIFDLHTEEAGRAVDRGVVVRIEPVGEGVFPEYDVAEQFRVLRILEEDGRIPVAPTLWLEPDRQWLGAPFYAMERVAGRIPTDNPPYHTGGWMRDEATPDERAAIWWSGVDTLARIHTLDPAALGLGFLEVAAPGDTPIERQLADTRRFFAWALDALPHPTVEDAFDWLDRERPRDPEPVRLCWGDARIGNMIFDGTRCAAVLDWEMATLGNPEQDLAWFLFLDRHHGEGLGVPRLPGFPGRDETVARWSDATGLAARHLFFYEVFAALRFSVIMMRVAQGMKKAGVLPADSTFEIDNTVSRLLAGLLELPPPAEALAGARAVRA